MRHIAFIVLGVVLLAIFQNCSPGSFEAVQRGDTQAVIQSSLVDPGEDPSEGVLPRYLTEKSRDPAYVGYLKRVGIVITNVASASKPPSTCAEGQGIYWVQYANTNLFVNSNVDEINACLGSPNFVWDEHEEFGFGLFAKAYFRLYGLYNRNSPYLPNRLSLAAQARIESEMWRIAKAYNKLEDANGNPNLNMGSENHNFAHVSGGYLAAQFLRQLPQYKNLKYDDGSNLNQQYLAWKKYLSKWFDERFKHGLLVEVGSGYEEDTLAAILGIYDFSDDALLRKKAEMYLNLSYASMAEEMLLNSRGSSKSRYKNEAPYVGIGNRVYNILFNSPGGIFNDRVATANLTSTYFPSPVVQALATDVQNRGVYSFKKRTPGPATRKNVPVGTTLLDPEKSTVRYGFSTPNYMVGTTLIAPLNFANLDWDHGMGFRWQGVTFAAPQARIGFEIQETPECLAKNGCASEWHGFEEYVSLQDRNIFIIQKNLPIPPNHTLMSKANLSIYLSPLLDEVIEKSGWIFVRSGNAFSAVRVLNGDYAWSAPWKKSTKVKDRVFVNLRSDSPVVVVTNDAFDYRNDFAYFQEVIVKQSISYQTSMTKFATLTFYGPSQIGKVQNLQLTTSPVLAFDSPFIKSTFNSGYIVVRKGDLIEVFDNRDPNNPKHTTQTNPDPGLAPTGFGQETPLIFQ